MKVNLLSTLFLLIGIYANAQINMDDSTVQVITYWEKGDKKDYLVTKERTKIKGTVTTSKESSTYTFALTVKDMTEDSYTIELDYKNIGSEMKGDLMESVINLTKDLKIIYKTDENGSFSEVVNWKEIKIYIQKSMDVVRKDSKSNPEIKTIINQLETTISTKEAIESLFVKDIQQFHAFHGAKYKLGEVLSENIELPNVIGPKPFEAVLTVVLQKINKEEENYSLEMSQIANKEQMINATYEYLLKMAKNLNAPLPKREDLKDLKNEIVTQSRIHDSGWVLNSTQISTTHSGQHITIDKRTIVSK